MPVEFRNDCLELVPAKYVPPAVGARDARSPGHALQVAFVSLVDALARAGWDVPDFDVRLGVAGKGSAVRRSVERVSGRTFIGPFSLETWGSHGLNRVVTPPGVEVRFDGPDAYPTVAYLLTEGWEREDVAVAVAGPRPSASVRYRHGRDGYEPDREGVQADGRARPALGEVLGQALAFVRGLEAMLRELPAVPGHADVGEGGDANLRRLATREAVPVPAGFPTLFSWLDRNDAHKLAYPDARWDDGSHDYVLSGNGARVVPLGGRAADGRAVPAEAYRGFCYASADPAVRAAQSIASSTDADAYPVAVRLLRLDEVYVVDNARFAAARKATFARLEAEDRDRMSDRELDACMAEVGTTIVPAWAYDGSFAEPTYLIGRQLGPDEARMVRGKVSHLIDGDHERVVLASDDGEFTLFDDPSPSRSERDRAKRVAADAKALSRMAELPFRRVGGTLPDEADAEPEPAMGMG